MTVFLRILASVLVVATFVVWLVTGANRGWTKTRVPATWLDEVTGLEGIRYEKSFVPGLDFLGAAALTAVGLAGGSLLFRKPKPKKHQSTDIP